MLVSLSVRAGIAGVLLWTIFFMGVAVSEGEGSPQVLVLIALCSLAGLAIALVIGPWLLGHLRKDDTNGDDG